MRKQGMTARIVFTDGVTSSEKVDRNNDMLLGNERKEAKCETYYDNDACEATNSRNVHLKRPINVAVAAFAPARLPACQMTDK
jgi:hypothetical protein